MASRKEQKEQARAARIAQEQATAAQAQRTRRIQVLGGVVAIAVIVIVVAIVVSSNSGPKQVKPGKANPTAMKQVNTLLAGIPQSGNTLGNPNAKVAITEYGDLECSVCDVFATPPSFTNPENQPGSGWEDQLISQYVRTGKAKLIFKSLETASGSNPDQNAFKVQQIAAEAAGMQNKEWNFVELMYNQQGPEGQNYVNESYLQGIAKEIPGLNFQKWMADRKLASLAKQLPVEARQGTAAAARAQQGPSTPTVVISGPKGSPTPIVGLPQGGYGAYVAEIKSVE